MWYFTWILGIVAALAVGIINVMWYEAEDNYKHFDEDRNKTGD
jgi:cyd operon protein YbgT